MPQLCEHQLRVAAVADMVCQNFDGSINRGNIIRACLLHDMGNIIKFDLTKTNSLLNQELDINFWQKVKDQYIQKYGIDEHKAHMAILKELGVSSKVVGLVDAVGFTKGPQNLVSPDFDKKICAYCDMRVGPFGVIRIEQRFADLRKRYAHRHQEWGAEQKRQEFEQAMRGIEQQIFEHCSIKPRDITEQAMSVRVEKLKTFAI